MALLIDNVDLTPLPASVTPIPSDILTGEWQFKLTPGADSASITYQFGFIGLFGYGGDNKVSLTDNGGGVGRLDITSDGGGQRQIGQISWSLGAVFLVEIDVPNSTVTVTILSGTASFGGGWDSSNATTATRTVASWTWGGDTALAVGGFPGLFELDGTITDVADEFGPNPPVPDLDPPGIAADGGYGTQVLRANLPPSGLGANTAFGTAQTQARATAGSIAPVAVGSTHTARAALPPSGLNPREDYGTQQVGAGATPSGIAAQAAYGTATARGVVATAGIAADGQTGEQTGEPTTMPQAAPSGIAPNTGYGTGTVRVAGTVAGIAPLSAYGTPSVGSVVSYTLSGGVVLLRGTTTSQTTGFVEQRRYAPERSTSDREGR